MSETEFSQTPEGHPPDGRPAEGAESTSPPAPPRAAQPPKPKIGDTRPAPSTPPPPRPAAKAAAPVVPLVRPGGTERKEGRPDVAGAAGTAPERAERADDAEAGEGGERRARSRRRSGREKRSRQVGRYLVCVHVQPHMTQIAMLEGRSLVEHYVARASDDTNQIDGNVYRGRVQNVLPGMEAAFVDIGIPKNAVLYRGDVRYDKDDIEGGASNQPRIEDVLKAGQTILCQVTKNPIGAKGARLTQEVSLPGRFAVLVPNSSAFGISTRLGDNERRRLRRIIDEV
ncbi:MAG TPA: ribonuclease E/G, partial [Acidimicrobiales bacterium]